MLRRSLFSQIFCKGTKNIIDKRIILSIFASILSIIKEVYIRQRMLNTITETLLRFMPDGMMEEQIVKYGIKL